MHARIFCNVCCQTGDGGRRSHEQTKSGGKHHRHKRHRKHQQQQQQQLQEKQQPTPVTSPSSEVFSPALDVDHRNAERQRDADVPAVTVPPTKNTTENHRRWVNWIVRSGGPDTTWCQNSVIDTREYVFTG